MVGATLAVALRGGVWLKFALMGASPCGYPEGILRVSKTTVTIGVSSGPGKGIPHKRELRILQGPDRLIRDLVGVTLAAYTGRVFGRRWMPGEAGVAGSGWGPLAGAFRSFRFARPFPKKPTRVSTQGDR